MLNLFISYCHADSAHETEARKTLNFCLNRKVRYYPDQAGSRLRESLAIPAKAGIAN